ncbi:MAG: 50S ribosomal protein L9 [Candidatus Symbiobacter sp.]|nr:50S ribosomal protein L9 [Candidatus Symbiobacter sp.]
MVEVILLERVERLGQIGDVVKVRPGFARNFLLPKQKALRATKENREEFEKRKAKIMAENLTRRQDAEAAAARMSDLTLYLVRQAGESGQLYGSVTARDLSDAVTEAGFQVNRTQIVIDRPIKTTGLAKIRLSLHPEVTVMATVSVAQTLDEAKALVVAAAKQAKSEAAADAAEAEALAAAASLSEAGATAGEAAAGEASEPAKGKKRKAKAKDETVEN